MKLINRAKRKLRKLMELPDTLDQLRQAIGRVEARQLHDSGNLTFDTAEFRVYSQWGEDGLIQYLIDQVAIPKPIFIEFGTEDYVESNTRFLLQNNNWAGLLIDGSPQNIESIKRDALYWRHNIKAECAFITRDNINELITKNGIAGDIGLLSVDLDGIDYWVWEAITVVQPRIVICEYNSLFGPAACVTVPYKADFMASQAHYSRAYFGASLAALELLGQRKGYRLIGSNSAGCNAFFVRNDLCAGLTVKTSREAYVRAQFQNLTNEAGELIFGNFDQRFEKIRQLTVWDVGNNTLVPIENVCQD